MERLINYPGGRPYPGGGGVPIPSKGGKAPKKADAGQPLPNFRGKLKQMDKKTISLELGDNRVLDFRRTDKTKFLKSGDEVKEPKFTVGDQLSIEGSEAADGTLTAVNVYWEKGASTDTASSGKDKNEGAVDTWAKDEPAKGAAPAKEPAREPAKEADKEAAPEPARTREAAVEKAPPPSKAADDPGPPTLRRGRVSDPSRQHAEAPLPQIEAPPTAAERPAARPVEREEAPPPPRRASDDGYIPIVQRPDDPLIRKAANAALDFTETLPNYVCQEMMSRYQSESHPANWHPLDVVTAALVYEGGKEDYRNVTVNGKPRKSIEDTGGAWSTGEFGTVLIDLFSPATNATFHYRKDARTAGINTKEYDFEVARENSHWSIHMASQTYMPAYKGSVWIDPATARVLRIEMQAQGFPEAFPTDTVESATDYQYIRLGDAKQYLLPVHAETLSCQRGTNYCSRNTIDFRNYKKYSGESTITFGVPK
ncbi:MAG: hypothetical protein LAO30_23310 [Acidobacteriia bacterium]|nr:hypothetical protein [Terriglobia bacterium]